MKTVPHILEREKVRANLMKEINDFCIPINILPKEDYIDLTNEECEYIIINISEDTFFQIAKMACDQDVTIDRMVTRLLKNTIEK